MGGFGGERFKSSGGGSILPINGLIFRTFDVGTGEGSSGSRFRLVADEAKISVT